MGMNQLRASRRVGVARAATLQAHASSDSFAQKETRRGRLTGTHGGGGGGEGGKKELDYFIQGGEKE